MRNFFRLLMSIMLLIAFSFSGTASTADSNIGIENSILMQVDNNVGTFVSIDIDYSIALINTLNTITNKESGVCFMQVDKQVNLDEFTRYDIVISYDRYNILETDIEQDIRITAITDNRYIDKGILNMMKDKISIHGISTLNNILNLAPLDANFDSMNKLLMSYQVS